MLMLNFGDIALITATLAGLVLAVQVQKKILSYWR